MTSDNNGIVTSNPAKRPQMTPRMSDIKPENLGGRSLLAGDSASAASSSVGKITFPAPRTTVSPPITINSAYVPLPNKPNALKGAEEN